MIAEKTRVQIHCSECGKKLEAPGGQSVGMICPRDGHEPTIDEQIILMRRTRILKTQRKSQYTADQMEDMDREHELEKEVDNG